MTARRDRPAPIVAPAPRPSRLRRTSGRLGWVLLGIGGALVVETALQHPGGVAIGYLMGGAFALAGGMRVWLARKGM